MEDNKQKKHKPYNGRKGAGRNNGAKANDLAAVKSPERRSRPEGDRAETVTNKKPYDKKVAKKHSKGYGSRERRDDRFDDIKSYGGTYVKTYADGEAEDDIIPYEAYRDDGGEEDTSVVAGRNAVRELLRSDRSVDKLFVKKGQREGSLVVIVTEAIAKGVPVIEVNGEKLDSLADGVNHQGVVALAAQKQYTDVDGILRIAEERGEIPLVVIADCIEDPRNLGALIRCAECAGAHGIIIPKRRSAGLTGIVAKSSAGAIEHMAIAKVSNLSHTVETLKKKGLWIFASEAGATPYYDADFKVPAAIIFGSEGAGVGKMLKEKCDFLVSIPMYGKVNSLNVSTAASVILCHAARMQHS